MQTASPQSRRLGEYTNVALEVFIVSSSVLPFFVLAYFYTALPERVPVFLDLGGEVRTWAEKSVLSVFRVPLMAVDTQLICLLAKYGTVKSEPHAPPWADEGLAELHSRRLGLRAGLWDWLRLLAAVKMGAASLDTVFLSIERLKPFARPAYAVTAIAALLGVAGVLFYGYRLLALGRGAGGRPGGAQIHRPVDARRVYGGILYFDPSDPAPFAHRYVLNFANKWAWALAACVTAYPLLVFLPS